MEMTDTFNTLDASIRNSKDALMKDVGAVVTDADVLMKQVVSSTADEIAATRTKVEARLNDTLTGLQNAGHAVTARVSRAAERSGAYVHENPWKVIGVSAAIGLIAALLLRRR